MSIFTCEICGKVLVNSDENFITSCEHYPLRLTYDKKEKRSEIIIGKIEKNNSFGVNVPGDLNYAFERLMEYITKNK